MTDYRTQIPELSEAISALEIVDTHEHLPPFEDRQDAGNDVLTEYLIHYFSCDLVSAGLSQANLATVRDASRPIAERWKLVEPYWEACRLTGYGRALDLAAQGIYGIDGVRGETVEKLNDAFLAARKKGSHYRRVLKDLSHIRVSVADIWGETKADPDFFRVAYNIGGMVSPSSLKDIDRLAGQAGVRPRSLNDWLDICEAAIENAIADGVACLKCAIAYDRSLHFSRATFAQAEAGWNSIRSERNLTYWDMLRLHPGADFENFMMHHILRIAEKKGLAVQFHTGLQEGNGNILANSNPLLLTNLLLDYTGVRFDLFHCSYPFMGELGALCKNFANAYIDMCWGHIISPRACMLALDEWLDAVPFSKISAFGGDYCFVDGVYGHQALARENVCKTLSRKVLAGEMSTDRALAVAKAVLCDNPARILGV